MPLFKAPNIEKLKAKGNVNGLIKALGHGKDKLDQLGNMDKYIRRDAARALGEIRDPLAIEPLTTAIEDPSRFVREEAIIALSCIGESSVVEPLIKRLKVSDIRTEEQKLIIEALGKVRDTRAVEPLITFLESNNFLLQIYSAEALGSIGDKRSEIPLLDALFSSDKSVVIEAASEAVKQFIGPNVAILIEALEDPRRRESAAIALDHIGWRPDQNAAGAWYWIAKKDWRKCAAIGAPAVKPLTAALQSNNWEERLDVIEALDMIDDPAVLEPLNTALKDKSKRVRQSATAALGKFDDPRASKPLIAALRSKHPEERLIAVNSLAEIGGSTVLDPLVTALVDKSNLVRRAAVQAIGQIGDDRAVESLVPVLKDSHQDVRQLAAKTLDQFGWKPEHNETGAWYWIAKGKVEKCKAIGPPAVLPLLNVLKEKDSNIRKSTIEALGQMGDERAAEPLIAVLKSGKDEERIAAVKALRDLGDDHAVKPLITALKDPNQTVREHAAKTLDQFGWKPDQTITGAWYWIAKGEVQECVRIGATAVPPLLNVVKDSEYVFRKSAMKALGQIGGTRALKFLIATLQNQDHPLRMDAATALGQIGNARAVESLIEVLKDKDAEVAAAATESLGQIGRPALHLLITTFSSFSYPEASSRAALVLGEIGNIRAVEPLIKAVESSYHDVVRQAATSAMIKIGGAAVEPLIDYLTHRSRRRRQAAAEVLVQIYQTGQLEASHKQRILEHRAPITSGHVDDHKSFHSDFGAKQCVDFHEDSYEHSDHGIGVDFPL